MNDTDKTITTEPLDSRDNDLMTAKLFLEPLHGLPESEKFRFMRFYLMFSKQCRLANIERYDIPYYQVALQNVINLLDIGQYQKAAEIQARVLQDLNLTSSINGTQLYLGVGGVRRTESISRFVPHKEQKTSKLKKFFGKDKEQEEYK